MVLLAMIKVKIDWIELYGFPKSTPVVKYCKFIETKNKFQQCKSVENRKENFWFSTFFSEKNERRTNVNAPHKIY